MKFLNSAPNPSGFLMQSFGILLLVAAILLIPTWTNWSATLLLAAVVALRLPQAFPDIQPLRRWGVWLLVTSVIFMALVNARLGLCFTLLGLAVGGSDAGRLFLAAAFRYLTLINPERWVDLFGLFFLALGAFGVVGTGYVVYSRSGDFSTAFLLKNAGLLLCPPANPTAEGLAALDRIFKIRDLFLLGFASSLGMILGLGIRRRWRWTGLVGLCLSFYWLLIVGNKAFQNAGGDLMALPQELLRLYLELGLAWVSFFGFYSLFSPWVAGLRKTPEPALEGQMRETDAKVREARERLETAEVKAAQAARSLADERTRFQTMFSTVSEGICLWDEDQKIRNLNPACSRILEAGSEDWIGEPLSSIWKKPGVETPLLREVAFNIGVGGSMRPVCFSEEGLLIYKGRRGEIRRQISFAAKPVLDSAGEFLTFVGLFRDVTLEKEMQSMKNEFVSNVSHELRTPLTSIRAYAEMLIDGEADQVQTRRDYLDIIQHETDRLTGLINDILDLAKLEAGRKGIRFEQWPVASWLQKMVEEVRPRAATKELTLTFESPAKLEEAEFDGDLLGQAVMNLLDNAVKFTPNGGSIAVTLEVDEKLFRVMIQDSGPGISAADQPRLFNKFFRVQNTLNQEAGGTGLGLALTRQIVLVHGGEISLESELGRGAKFMIEIPRQRLNGK